MIFSLNGSWHLSGRQENGAAPCPFNEGTFSTEVTVPGNIELALAEAGAVADPYVGMNAMQLRKYEFFEWSFCREFEYDYDGGKVELVCEGIDCIATIWINGNLAGKSSNALIPHRFDVGEYLKDGKNTIAIHIASANNAYRDYPLEISTMSAYPYNYEATRIRKPAHTWGWDICPRMAIGGIFRNIYLEKIPQYRICEDMLLLESIAGEGGRAYYAYKIETPEFNFDDLEITLSAHCGDHTWSARDTVWSIQSRIWINLDKVKLWWPRNYGKANIYDVTVELKRKSTGAVLAEHKFSTGLRLMELMAKPTWTESDTPDFQFFVNHVPIMVAGCNHVPADALHSKDTERLNAILDMACDLNCNMLRIWGGGIYEPDFFYERCDREGILVWQDFMMGCANYPTDKDFCDVIRSEAEVIIRKLRQHPCIALWAGDNECDCATIWGVPLDPNANIITRQVLPEVCRRLDPFRPFLPSSPWYSEEAVKAAPATEWKDPMFMASEQHLWGPRDYFKSDFYSKTKASFSSEIGYHGCPGVSSIKKFVTPGREWSFVDNDDWNYHASNPFLPDNEYQNYRTRIMGEQIAEMFGTVPDNLEEFALASQICQAEAKKYFIELMRVNSKMSGLLWWNLVDCWPQFSDAIVDYYYNKKLAYHYIKRVQTPVIVQVTDALYWLQKAYVNNISNREASGSYRIWDADSGEIFAEGNFKIAGGENLELARKRVCTTRQRLLLIEWTLSDGTRGVNHALCGNPQFDFTRYKKWLPVIAALDGSFDADAAAK